MLWRKGPDPFSTLFIIHALTCSVMGNSTTKTAKTVNIGVIVDRNDERSEEIKKSARLASEVANRTDKINLHPLYFEVDLRDSYELQQTICENIINHSVVALLGLFNGDTYSVMESYSRTLKLPFLLPTLTRGTADPRNNYMISMWPSFVDVVVDFIKYFQWTRFVYLYDTEDAMWRLQKLYEVFNGGQKSANGRKKVDRIIVAVPIPDVNNCREVLRKLDRNYSLKIKRIVVDLQHISHYELFLSQVIDVGMNRDDYHYLLGTLDMATMRPDLWRSFIFGGVNITGFQMAYDNTYLHLMQTQLNMPPGKSPSLEQCLTVDAVALLTDSILSIIKGVNFRHGKLYLQMNCSTKPGSFQYGDVLLNRMLNSSTQRGITGTLAFDAHGRRKGYTLEVHHLSYRSPLTKVGMWTQQGGFSNFHLESPVTSSAPKDNGTKIVTTIINSPFVQSKTKPVNGKPLIDNSRFEGYCIDMIETIAKNVSFNYIIRLVADNNYGSEVNGSWNGMIGEVRRGEAHIALASLSIIHKREKAIYFTKPFMTTGISIMIKRPEREKPGVFSFMDPLSLAVWGCISAGFFAVSFILYMVGRFSPYEWQEEGNGGTTMAPSDTFSFVNTLWFSLGALLQQGPDIFPRSLSGRILASAWWFFTLITISSYTANLAAFLTFEKLNTPINSVDDLVYQDKIKYGIQKSGSTFDFFNESIVDIYRKMFTVMQSNPSVYVDSSEDGWKKVISERGKYAFLLESSSNNYFNQRKPCKTMKVGRNLDRKGYGIGMSKEFELRHDINIAVLEMAERGDLLKLEQKWWYSKGQCGSIDGGEKGKNALNLSNVSGIFHILIGGLVVAMVISLSQILFYSKVKKHVHRDSYLINNSPKSEVGYRSTSRRVDTSQPVVTCTTSNGGEAHLISFDDDLHNGANGDRILPSNHSDIT